MGGPELSHCASGVGVPMEVVLLVLRVARRKQGVEN